MKREKVVNDLPDDLWPEILSRLPVKSLLRFRCVSPSWKKLIDDPNFALLHLKRFNTPYQSRFLCVFSRGQSVVKNSETLRTTLTLGFLQTDPESPNVLRPTSSNLCIVNWWSVCSSLDGLFLLHEIDRPADLMLWNPSIRKLLPLPPLPEIMLPYAQHQYMGYYGFGLGFDTLTKNYKAVKFVLQPEKGIHFAAVYTVGVNSWKLIECPIKGRKDLAFHCWNSSISFNGVLYGLAEGYPIGMKLVSFDLRTEVFASFELPASDLWKCYLSIIDDGCSVALIHLSMSIVSVWALDNKAWSWTPRYSLDIVLPPYNCFDDYEFLCFKKNGEMLMKWKNMVKCINFETRECKFLMEKSRKSLGRAPNMFTYKESLLLLS